MPWFRYDGNLAFGEGTDIIRVLDANNIVREVPQGGSVELTTSQLGVIDDNYRFTEVDGPTTVITTVPERIAKLSKDMADEGSYIDAFTGQAVPIEKVGVPGGVADYIETLTTFESKADLDVDRKVPIDQMPNGVALESEIPALIASDSSIVAAASAAVATAAASGGLVSSTDSRLPKDESYDPGMGSYIWFTKDQLNNIVDAQRASGYREIPLLLSNIRKIGVQDERTLAYDPQMGDFVWCTRDSSGRMLDIQRADGVREIPLLQSTVQKIAGTAEVRGINAASNEVLVGTKDAAGRWLEDVLDLSGEKPSWVLRRRLNRVPFADPIYRFKKWKIWIVAGQSNAQGNDARPVSAELNPADNRVWMVPASGRPNAGKIVPAVEPLLGLESTGGMGPGIEFAKHRARMFDDGYGHIVVGATYGGTGFGNGPTGQEGLNWRIDNTDPLAIYPKLLALVASAKLAVSGLGPTVTSEVAGMIWVQGEHDTSMGESTYATYLDGFIDQVRSDLATPNLPIIIGSMVPDYYMDETNHPGMVAIDRAHRDTPRRKERTAYMWGPDMGRAWPSSVDIHFPAQTQIARAKIMAEDTYNRALANVSSPAGMNYPYEVPNLTAKRIGGGQFEARWDMPLGRVTIFNARWRADGGSWNTVTLPTPLYDSFIATSSGSLIEVEVTTTNAVGTTKPSTTRC